MKKVKMLFGLVSLLITLSFTSCDSAQKMDTDTHCTTESLNEIEGYNTNTGTVVADNPYEHYLDSFSIKTYDADSVESSNHYDKEEQITTKKYKVADIYNVCIHELYKFKYTGGNPEITLEYSEAEEIEIERCMKNCLAWTVGTANTVSISGGIDVSFEDAVKVQMPELVDFINAEKKHSLTFSLDNSFTEENSREIQNAVEAYLSSRETEIHSQKIIYTNSFEGYPEAYYRLSLKGNVSVYETLTLNLHTGEYECYHTLEYDNNSFYIVMDWNSDSVFDIPDDIYEEAGIEMHEFKKILEKEFEKHITDLAGIIHPNVVFNLNDANGEKATCDRVSQQVSYCQVYGNLPVPQRPKHDFAYWSLEDGTRIDANTVVTKINNHELFAVWNMWNYKEYSKYSEGVSIDAGTYMQDFFIDLDEYFDMREARNENMELTVSVSFHAKEKDYGYQGYIISTAKTKNKDSNGEWIDQSAWAMLQFDKVLGQDKKIDMEEKGFLNPKTEYDYPDDVSDAEYIHTFSANALNENNELWFSFGAFDENTTADKWVLSRLRITISID